MGAWCEIHELPDGHELKSFGESYHYDSVAGRCNFSWWDDINPLIVEVAHEGFIGGEGRIIKCDTLPVFREFVNKPLEEVTGDDYEYLIGQQKKLLAMIDYCVNNRLDMMITV